MFLFTQITLWSYLLSLLLYFCNLAPPAKQRGDQPITSEDDLVAPSLDTEVFTSKNTPDTKKNEVQVSKERKGNMIYITGSSS